MRAIAAATRGSTKEQREFAADELALALGVGDGHGRCGCSGEALSLAALPGMLEALEAGWLTQRHALAVLRELDEVERWRSSSGSRSGPSCWPDWPVRPRTSWRS